MSDASDSVLMFRSFPGLRLVFNDRIKWVMENPKNRAPHAIQQGAENYRKYAIGFLCNAALLLASPLVIATVKSVAVANSNSLTELQSAAIWLLDKMAWLGIALGLGAALAALVYWEAYRVNRWLLAVGLTVVNAVQQEKGER